MLQAATASRLSVLLLTDIVGSTDLKTRLGLSEYARRLARHDEIVKKLIAEYPSAEILKDTGDGYFASFATTSDAVRFALRFQRAMSEQQWEHGDPLRARVGIHVGEVAQIDKEQTGKPKLVGMAADVAARVAKLAGGGQILLTRFAFNEARQFVSLDGPLDATQTLRWVAHGEYRLRGTDEATEIFEVGIEGVAPLCAPAPTADARRAVAIDDEETLGWRPAVGLPVPDRPHWVLDRRLGEGGFGEVWLGRHHKLGTRRVFKFCFDADRLRSFKREITLFRLLRDALGEREDIARLHEVKLDAPPYFLESDYTQGGDLHEWAAKQGGLGEVPLATRIDLVARVADAVSAAHSVGVLHKDIKPSNILIDVEGGAPRPRLADFGIGIIVDRSRLRERAITEAGFTQITQEARSSATPGTRLYAPPEVLAGRPFTVQGDVYALGVILYQMIVGDLTRPLAEGWERDVADELLRDDVAACVEGDPARRLSGAADLAKRLRSLPHRRAWQQEQRDQQRAQTRRRRVVRLLVGTAGVLAILLALAAAVAVRERSLREQADAARAAEARQRTVARGVADFLERTLTNVDPDFGGKDVSVAQTLDSAYERLEAGRAHDEPEVVASALKTLGKSYRALGQLDRAEQLLREALELTTRARGPDDFDTHAVRAELAICLSDQGKYEPAVAEFHQALAGLERTGGAENSESLVRTIDLALLLLKQNKVDEAERLARRVYDTRLRTLGPDNEHTITALETLAGAAIQRGDQRAATDLFGRIYETRKRTDGEAHALTRLAAHNYATMLLRGGHPEQAEPMFQQLVESQAKSLGESHVRTLAAMETLATARLSLGRREGALELQKKVVDLRRQVQGPEHPNTLASTTSLASILNELGRGAEAEALLLSLLAIQQRLLGDVHPDTLNTQNSLATSLSLLGRWPEAEALHRRIIDVATKHRGPMHPGTIGYRMNYANGFQRMKRYGDAERELLDLWQLAQREGAAAGMRRPLATRLAKLYERMNVPEKASQFKDLAAAATQPTTAAAVRTSSR